MRLVGNSSFFFCPFHFLPFRVMVRPALGTNQGLTYLKRSIEMLKKLLVSCFVVAAAVAVGSGGCGSSSDNTGKAGGTAGGTAGAAAGSSGGSSAGTTGGSSAGTTGGSAAGTTGGSAAGAAGGAAGGTAGAAGGTAGAGGGTAGAGGATAGAGGGTAGAGGATAGAGGGTAGAGGAGGAAPDIAALKAMCTSKGTMTAAPFSAADFCALYESVCGTMAGAIASGDCMATYTGWAGKMITNPSTDSLQSCVSYHLCNAQMAGGAGTHCPHAAGGGPCAHN
jgi:hypothetical protein